MLNSVHLIGRLGRDPDLRYTQGGDAICNFSLATDESYTDRNGERQQKTEWHHIVVFGKLAEPCSRYLKKGSLCFVEGKLTTRKWQDQSGNDRYTTEIRANRVQFLDRRDDQGRAASGNNRQAQSEADGNSSAFPSESSAMDDYPF